MTLALIGSSGVLRRIRLTKLTADWLGHDLPADLAFGDRVAITGVHDGEWRLMIHAPTRAGGDWGVLGATFALTIDANLTVARVDVHPAPLFAAYVPPSGACALQ